MIGPSRGGNLIAFRNTAQGQLGVVGSSAPEAAWVGRDMLLQGGNAFDAAVAAALAETVLVPSKCGLAGDLVALVRPAGQHSFRSLIAIGGAPARLARAVGERGLPTTGGLAVGVPAAPAGYAALATLGRLGRERLAAPAITFARRGFSWSPLNYDYTVRSAATLRKQNPSGTAFLPDGMPIPAGSWVRLPGHAEALEAFAEHGESLFHGHLGELVVDAVRDRGGVLTSDDLRTASAVWEQPDQTSQQGGILWTTPMPTHGPRLARVISGSHTSPETQVERVRRARGDSTGTGQDGGTSVITASDAEGNLAVVVHSLSHPTFGSGIVVPDLDLVLGNRAGRGFTPIPGHANSPVAGRRPVTTLHAWALDMRDRGGALAGATSGGEQQMPWNAQVLERLLAGEDIQSAVLDPLWSCDAETSELTREGIEVPYWGLTAGIQIVQEPGRDGVCRVVSDIRSLGGVAAA